ncbi:MAG: hypothetical protein JNL08_14880 [Planctomycetes bacterium]|nr:hypothetical protein [Planctomycetota bacterium]
MATNPASAPVPNQPADQQEEFTGVYGFFRRHQKKLLYTAGLFTLLTFSVTGPMMQAVGELFGTKREMASILVRGERVKLTAEDYNYGQVIQRALQGFSLPPVLPLLSPGEGGTSELANNLAILRRAAIAEGIDVSMVEVDAAIETVREQSNAESATRYAVQLGYSSLAQYRELVREAMRIGTYVRLQTLALDCSDAQVLQRTIENKEKITFRVAVFDEKAHEDQLKAQTTLTDDQLRAWLDSKDDNAKMRLQVYDSNHFELRFGALLLADGQFDPAQWQDTSLKDFAPPDDQLRGFYEQDKELRFKKEDGTFTPFEELKDQLLRLAQANQVMTTLSTDLRKQMDEAFKSLADETGRCHQELRAQNEVVRGIEARLQEPGVDKTAVEEELRLAKEVEVAKQAAKDAAEAAWREARAGWDFPAAFAAATKDKSGFVQRAMSGKRNIEALKDLDAAGVELGKWPMSAQARGLSHKGELGYAPARTGKSIAIYQVTDVLVRPLKPWEELRPLLEGAWFTEQAKTTAEAKKKAFEDALLRLAKGKIPERVTELEGKLAARVDERLAAWRTETEAGINEAKGWLERLGAGSDGQPPTQAQIAWQAKLDRLQGDLAKQDERRAAIQTEVQKQIEDEVATEAKKSYGDVLDAAAAEAGFTLSTIGPLSRELAAKPRFDKAYDPTTVFLFRSHAELKQGETTGVVQDATNRRWLCAVCTAVAPLEPADVTRREFERLRSGGGQISFAMQQAINAFGQAFTKEALVKRYDLQEPTGVQQEN